MTYKIAVPADLRIGGGSLAELPDVLARLGVVRPMIVTDAFLSESGVAHRVQQMLTEAGMDSAIFAGVVPDPTTSSLGAALSLLTEHRSDVVIGLGGGSPIDSAKALAVLALRGGELREIKAPATYDGPALPIVAIPTTAGTGSEATRFTVITDSDTGEKMLCAGSAYLPKAALVDFHLSVSMPPRLTADSGIDALTHAVEAYVSRQHQPFSDALALAAMKTIGVALRRATRDGSDEPARAAMMEAATLAGIAFSNSSVALVHGMSRPLGAHFGIAHGMANAMLFATVTEFSLGVADQRYAACARAIGVASEADADDVAASALVAELHQLAADLGVPSPAQLGIERATWDAAIDVMAQQALDSGSPAHNPRVPTKQQIAHLYARVYDGTGM